jgi:hypothetical protein
MPWADCHHYLGDIVAGRRTTDLPAAAAGIVGRYAAVATVMGGFFGHLLTVNKSAPYPATQLRRAYERIDPTDLRAGGT